MGRLLGGMAIAVFLSACSGGGAGIEVGDYPIADPAEPSTTTDTPTTVNEPPTTGTASPSTSVTTSTPAVSTIAPSGEVFCRSVTNSRGATIELCAQDLGFPGVRGAAFDPTWVAMAIVDPDIDTVFANTWGESRKELEVQTEGDISYVVASYAHEFEAFDADGARHRHAYTPNGYLGDDPMLLAGGAIEVDGSGSPWALWFTRQGQVCIEWPVFYARTPTRCADSAEGHLATAAWLVTVPGEHCYPSQAGFAAAVAAIDDETTGHLAVGGSETPTSTSVLPNGNRVGWALVGHEAGAFQTASFTYEAAGRTHQVEIHLPEPGTPTGAYPSGCVPLPPPPTDEAIYPTIPPFVYPSQ